MWADGEWIVWAGRDGYAYQPSLDKWREVASVPIAGQVIATVEASNEVIVVSSAGEVASFDLRGDCWRALPAVPLPRPQSASDDEVSPRTLFWTGQDLLLTTWDPPFDRNTAAGSSRLWRLDADGWKDTGRTPLQGGWPGGVWTGAELLFMGGPRDAAGRPAAAAYDPVTGAWREFRQECGPSTADAVWTGELLITPWSATGPSGVECYTLPESDDRARYRPVMVWTGEELIVWSGGRGEGQTARPDGVAFRPAD